MISKTLNRIRHYTRRVLYTDGGVRRSGVCPGKTSEVAFRRRIEASRRGDFHEAPRNERRRNDTPRPVIPNLKAHNRTTNGSSELMNSSCIGKK